ncbi:MAG TPA: hypothetical protein VFO38_02680 [Candidatus Saccharimonadales bacterium]|nr:hypothetical protein [Candidatus Saccharimonadales bacterium]
MIQHFLSWLRQAPTKFRRCSSAQGHSAEASSPPDDTTQLHSDLLPGPVAIDVLHHCDLCRVTAVGWVDGTERTILEWVAVVRFAKDWPEEFVEINELIKQGASIGDTFRSFGLKPVQNRLAKIAMPRACVPDWIQQKLGRSARLWDIEVYDFCAEVSGVLYEYAQICEFHPRPSFIPKRQSVGSLAFWRRIGRFERATEFLRSASRPRIWDTLLIRVARISALVQACRTACAARYPLRGHP